MLKDWTLVRGNDMYESPRTFEIAKAYREGTISKFEAMGLAGEYGGLNVDFSEVIYFGVSDPYGSQGSGTGMTAI